MLGLHDWQSENCSRQHKQIAMNNRSSGRQMDTTCLRTNEQAVQLRPSQLANVFLCNLCTCITLQVVISRAGAFVHLCERCPLQLGSISRDAPQILLDVYSGSQNAEPKLPPLIFVQDDCTKTDGKGAKAASLVNFVCEKTAGPGLGSFLLLLNEFWLAVTRTRQEGKECVRGGKKH